MNPETLKAAIAAAVVAAALLLGFGGGWLVQGWRLKTQIAEQERTAAVREATAATGALDTLKADAALIHTAATEYATVQDALSPKIAALTKEIRNAPKPLDPGCKPDAYRVRNLEAGIDAANAAAARH